MLTFIPDCWVENIFPAYFHIEITQQIFHILPRKLIKYTSWFHMEAVFYVIALILTWDVHIQNNNIAPVTS
jgi:hypothetical protein